MNLHIKELKERVLMNWLIVDFDNIFERLGFGKSTATISKDIVYDTIRCLDHETTVEKNPSVNYVITLIALMWEYVDKNEYDIRKIIVKFLSRIGYPTSAIIVDEEFDRKECKFLSLDSTMEQLLVTLNQENNSITVCDFKFLLTNFQMQIWNSMDTEQVIGISAPTSAGKSFVILLKLLDKLSKEALDIVYIVPTLSLVNQVTEDFNKNIKMLNIEGCRVANSFIEHNQECNYIYVLTQEKAIAAFCDKVDAFSSKMILVADEIQNIERIKEDNDERAKTLYDTLNEFRYMDNVVQIILAGPRIDDMEKVGENIFGVETEDITSLDSPVLSLTYSIFKDKDKYYLKQYSSLNQRPIVRAILNDQSINGYGKKQYNEKYLSFLNELVIKLDDQQNIIFAPTAQTARKIACAVTGNDVEEERILELVEYLKKSVHPSYSMCVTLVKGVAYHHGRLPLHVRRTVEKAIHEKWISNIACTTTLLQGVNLPAQNIIIRNPHLYINKRSDSAELSNYEMANLRGRAGRLLKDFIGRTYVLDETSFVDADDSEQLTLFDDVTKELPTNYEERYEKYQQDIQKVITTEDPIDINMKPYGDLITYIRQSILKYGDNAKQRMENVGVTLTKEQIAAIKLKLGGLSVPKDICAKNRYWDPFVLDVIYREYSEKVPVHPMERGCKAKIDRMLKFLRDTDETRIMYERCIPASLQKGAGRSLLVDLCMKWSKEEPLSEILSKKFKDNITDETADEIEDYIEILQNTVSYKVPLLLKPIFDIKNPESMVLSCMQLGVCNQFSRKITDIGIARECAIYLNANIFAKYIVDEKKEEELEEIIRNILEENKERLPYWIKVQIEFL